MLAISRWLRSPQRRNHRERSHSYGDPKRGHSDRICPNHFPRITFRNPLCIFRRKICPRFELSPPVILVRITGALITLPSTMITIGFPMFSSVNFAIFLRPFRGKRNRNDNSDRQSSFVAVASAISALVNSASGCRKIFMFGPSGDVVSDKPAPRFILAAVKFDLIEFKPVGLGGGICRSLSSIISPPSTVNIACNSFGSIDFGNTSTLPIGNGDQEVISL